MSNESNYLMSLVGKEVKINRGGPDTVLGKLLDVQSDYLILHSRDGAVYVQTSHIKSITENRKNKSSTYSEAPRYYVSSNFNELLEQLKHHFCQINGGGPEKLEGFIVEVTSTHVLLVVNREVIRIPIFHIRSISVKEKNKSSSSNRSGSNRSGQRSGQRNGHSSGQRSGHSSGQRSGQKSGHRSGQKSGQRSSHSSGDHRSSHGSSRRRCTKRNVSRRSTVRNRGQRKQSRTCRRSGK